jgi:sugar phosphate isomerase/epimerase
MNRKDFLKSLGFLAVGTTAGFGRVNKAFATNLLQAERKKVIGVQLWSVRDLMNQDVPGTLKGLADCGYLAIECFGYNNAKYFNIDINDFSKMVTDFGMKITSSHLPARYTPETKQEGLDWWKDTADKHKAIGCDTMVIPALPTLRGVPREVEWLGPVCEYINEVNDIAKARGMRAGFHNHNNDENRMQNGEVIIDYLIKNTDPSFFIQLDNHNMVDGGRCPIEFLHQYKSRTQQLHVKDDDIIGASGKIDFEELFTVAAQYGIYEPIVEVENYPIDVMECMCQSAAYLLNAPYVQYFG